MCIASARQPPPLNAAALGTPSDVLKKSPKTSVALASTATDRLALVLSGTYGRHACRSCSGEASASSQPRVVRLSASSSSRQR
jgi:hypothetical protein